MDETEIKHVIEAALLAAGRPLTFDALSEIFEAKGTALDRATLKRVMDSLSNEYSGRGIELKEVATGFRVQVKRSMTDWLQPLWEERAPRYTRALLETLALVAYRQPITRAEIEEVRGVVVSTNIVRTLLERNWIRVVGYRDVPGKPAMFGTTKEFLDYFGLKRLEDLPTLAEIKDSLPELSPQTDLLDSLEGNEHGVEAVLIQGDSDAESDASAAASAGEEETDDDSELDGADLGSEDSDDDAVRAKELASDDLDDSNAPSAEIIPLRAADEEP